MNSITDLLSSLERLLPVIPGVRNMGMLCFSFLLVLGALLFDDIKKRRAQAGAPVDVGTDDPPSLLRAGFFLVLAMGTIISFAGILFVPAETWSQLGTGFCAGLSILAFLYGLKRYRLGLWRNNPRQTKTRARIGVVVLPLVAFFAFFATLVLTGGAIYTGLFGRNETMPASLTKHFYHDRYGNHRCLKSPAFGDNFASFLFSEFCGIEAEDFAALPAHFDAELDIKRSALGYVVIGYRRR